MLTIVKKFHIRTYEKELRLLVSTFPTKSKEKKTFYASITFQHGSVYQEKDVNTDVLFRDP
jgi:hypothetical protein